MYYNTRINYKRRKNPDGSVTVTRIPEYTGIEIIWSLPVFVILFGIAATMYDVVALKWDDIGGLWNGIWTAEIIVLMLAPILTAISFVLENEAARNAIVNGFKWVKNKFNRNKTLTFNRSTAIIKSDSNPRIVPQK